MMAALAAYSTHVPNNGCERAARGVASPFGERAPEAERESAVGGMTFETEPAEPRRTKCVIERRAERLGLSLATLPSTSSIKRTTNSTSI